MKIGIACDHGGIEYKEIIKKMLAEQGHEVIDYGCHSSESCDYPDFAYQCAKSVSMGINERGIVVCGSGIGVSIVANKVKGIRCALCSETTSAVLSRSHNNANMLAMGQRIIGEQMMKDIVNAWMNTPFSQEERHQQRIKKIAALEE